MPKFEPLRTHYHPYSGGNKKAKKKVGFFDKLPAEHVLELGQKVRKAVSKKLSGKKKSRSVQPKTKRFAR